MHAVALRCEHRQDTPCIDDPAPRFGWDLESGERQTAYRVLVERTGARGTWWDSGKVGSAETASIPYAGRPLAPVGEYVWRVQVWDESGVVSDWSEPARFRTGPATWTAEWIARDPIHDPPMPVPGTDTELDETDFMMRRLEPCPYFRRSFEVTRETTRATVYATARGVFELELNGTRVGDAVLAPGWTDYRQRIEYDTYDVTDLLRSGENVLGAIAADGWYSGFVGMNPRQPGNHYGVDPELLCELHLEHPDGSRTVVATDESWRAARGPLVYSDLLMGERYDARRELEGWSQPGSADAGWHRVVTRARDDARLVPARSQPMRVTEHLRPVALTERAPGVHVFDLGQNMVGWVKLAVEGERGTRVQMRFAEMLEPDGSLYLENLRSARPLDTYVLRGGGPEVFEPRFTFHGFRYVEVTGLPGEPTPDTLTGCVVHSDTPRSGWFECSDDTVNQLWRNINWGQRGNFVSVPTDCPQRDERLGWLADAQVFLPTASLNMDIAAFITKWGDDMLDSQFPDGAYPDVAPRLVFSREGAPAWGDAGIIVPWVQWQRYGDRRLVERHWGAMERYMDHLARHNPDLLWTARRGNDYGDWLSVGEYTPRDVLATAYWAYDAKLMTEMAEALDKPERAEYYRRLRAGIVAAFNRAYVGEDARIEGDTQTVYLMALHMDLLPEELRQRVAERLVENIERNGGHLSTGFVGVGLLCPTLSRAGYSDVAHKLLRKDTFPSWGYSIRHGATTIWERWDGWTEDAGFQTPMMNSFNHYSLGSVGEWLYEYVAGIRPAEPGYARVIIAPEPGELEWARAEYRSVRGPILSSWRQDGDTFHLDVELPPNVTGTVVLPDGDEIEVGPGQHTFTAERVAA
jgi:alpha-L-rhamnosidase